MKRNPLHVILALAAAAAAGCGSSSSGSGKMSVHLVDAPGDYLEVDLDVQRVEIHSDAGGWLTLGTPDKVVNLLALTNGVAETLADGATLPAGHYGQLRLVLGSRNTVKASDGVHDLKVPSGMQTGVKLNVSFDVQAGTTKDVFIDLDAHRSVFVHQAGASGQYILRPVVRAFDRVVTGSIAGTLTDAQTHAAIPDAIVMAETVDAAGVPTVVRTVHTATDGSYALDLLPVGASYYVVSQPVTGAVSYAALASPAIALSTTAPVQPWSAAFSTVAAGAASGHVVPAATDADADLVVATQQLTAGTETRTLVVRTAPATVVSGVESWSLDALPPATYSVAVERRTLDTAGNETVTDGTPSNVTVASGATATVDLAIP
jgi:hypothetical protein